MLEGLEVIELTLSEVLENVDYRIDAEFHRKMPADNPVHQYLPIGEILELSQYGISIDMNEDGVGYPIYRMNEIENMLCSRDIAKHTSISTIEAEPFFLVDGDVLFNRTNSQVFVGRTGIYKPFDNAERIFASYLIRLVPNREKVLPEYLTTFLNSSLGVLDVKRRARISINQSNVNAEEVKAVRIPLLDIGFQKKIANLFTVAYKTLIQSVDLYAHAETLLLDVLGLRDWQPPQPLTYEQPASAAWAAGRLDAEYFNPRVQSLYGLLNAKGLTIEDVAPLRRAYFVPTRNPTFQYIEIGDVTGSGEADSSTVASHEAADRATWYVKSGDVITSTVRPIRRLSALIKPEQDGFVCSSGFAVLQPQGVSPEVLLVYLRLPAIVDLMNLHTTASLYPAIAVPDILNIPFLPPSKGMNDRIIASVQASHTARRQAKQLLEAAKRAVEIAIENSEAVAMAFLAHTNTTFNHEEI